MPPKWLEAKILRIRKLALESDQVIGTDATIEKRPNQKITAKLFDENKQLIVKREDLRTGDKKTRNLYLTASVNVERASNCPWFCRTFAQWEPTPAMKQGLTSFTYDDLNKDYPVKALQACANSQAVLIGHKASDDIRALFKKIFSAAKVYSSDLEALKFGYSSIFDTVFLFVKIGDMPDFSIEEDLQAKHLEKKVRTPLQHFLDHLEAWGGVKPERVLPFVDHEKIKNLSELTDEMMEKLAEEQEAEEAYKQDLEQAQKTDAADKSGESKKAKKVENQRAEILEGLEKTGLEVKAKLQEVEDA